MEPNRKKKHGLTISSEPKEKKSNRHARNSEKDVPNLSSREMYELAFSDNEKKIEDLERTITALSTELRTKYNGSKSHVKCEDTSKSK